MKIGPPNKSTGRVHFLFQTAAAAFSSWRTIIGTVIASIALSNLILRLPKMSISDALRWLLNAYQQTVHPPIDFMLGWLPFSLPGPVKDILVVYLAVGGVMFRSLWFGRPRRHFPFDIVRLRVVAGIILQAIGWPYYIRFTLKRPLYVVRGKRGYNGRLPARSREQAEAFLKATNSDGTVVCDDRQLVITYAVALLISVLTIILVNAATSDLGPG